MAPPPSAASHASSAAEGSQKPLSGLSLYAGISFSAKNARSDKERSPSSGNPVTASSSPGADTGTTATAPAPATTPSWSAALRFAPRKASSSSASAANRNRPRAAIVAPSFSSSSSNPLVVDEEAQHEESKSPDISATVVSQTHGTGRSQSNPAAVRSGSRWSNIASGSAAPQRSPQLAPAAPPGLAATSPLLSTPTVALSSSSSTASYALPVVTHPPELRLSQAELDADKLMARDAAIARGERTQPQHQHQREWGADDEGDDEGGPGVWDEEDDVNGFAMSSAGQKARKKRYKRKRAHSPGRHHPPSINWDADYDPRTPNDYAAWKGVVRNRREALKRMEAQKRRDEKGDDMEEEDEKDSASERDREIDEERLRKYRNWAPPPSYAKSGGGRQQPAFNVVEDEEEKLYISPPPPEPPVVTQCAPQGSTRQASPPPAFVQVAQPQPPPADDDDSGGRPPSGSPLQPPPPPSSLPSEASIVPQRVLTGEEVYQRRLAMSQQFVRPPPPQSAMNSSPFGEGESPRAHLPQSECRPLPPSAREGEAKLAPPAMDLAARQSAAAAIAARLASIAPPPPGPPPAFVPSSSEGAPTSDDREGTQQDGDGDFATRLMTKWGHQSGQGLGAEGNQGMTEALVMNKVPASKTVSKLTGGRSTGEGFGPHTPTVGGGGARGKYTTPDPRAKADLDKYGAPSEVVLLHGLLSPPTSASRTDGGEVEEGVDVDVEEGLPGEIADECAKYGYVQRVAIFPHVTPPSNTTSSSSSSTGARSGVDGETGSSGNGGVVFVVFTGLVGAYKAVRDLQGRFFSGRRVRARYFDQASFSRGEESWREEVQHWLAGRPPSHS